MTSSVSSNTGWAPWHWLMRSIARQWLVGIAALLVLVIGFFTTDLLWRQQQHLSEQQQAQARHLSQTLAVSGAVWLLSRDVVGLNELIDAQRQQSDLDFAMLVDRHGRVLAHTDSTRVGANVLDLPDSPEPRVYARDAKRVDVVMPSFVGAVHVGWARVGLSQRSAQAQMRQLRNDALLYGVLAGLLGTAFACALVRRMTRDLRAIELVAERVEQGDSLARVPGLGPDEIGRLGRYLNRMLDRLQQRGQALADSENYNKSLFADSRVAMLVMDPDSLRFVDCNVAAQQIFRVPSREALLGMRPQDVSAPVQYDGMASDVAAVVQIRMALTQGERVFEWRHQRPDGELWDAEVRLMVIQTQRGRFLQITLEDITARRRAEQEIHRLAYFDALTGLPNRRRLLDRLGDAIDRAGPGEPAALMLVDIDHFKAINDTQGHAAGDRLLKAVAQRLQQHLPPNALLARLGGDEFGIIVCAPAPCPESTIEPFECMARTLVQAINQPFDRDDGLPNDGHLKAPHHCTASMGIVVFAGQLLGADEVLQHADTALYKAKASGRNQHRFFDPAMHAAVLERVALELELRRALVSQQLVLYLQPQIGDQHEVLGAEVLLRWIHPTRGLVPPMAFIPLAEETDLIIPIGQWVLEQACEHLAQWANDPVRAYWTLAVNVSARQMMLPDFHLRVQALLRHSGINPQRLKIELTESVMVEDAEATLNAMHELKAMGVGFSMDDFGTGYSSLSYLKRLPLDQLKIDRAFVRDVTTNAHDVAIVRTLVTLGQNLGIDVIAEGVETVAQRELLHALGCRAYQGYLFGKPFPIDDLSTWQATHAKRFGAMLA